MKKINCIIADDEVLARNVIASYIGKLERLSIGAICATGLEVYTAIRASSIDLLFLDIQMPQLSGIELLRTLKNPPAVIITTAYSEFAVEGYELNVIDYLLKPISFERFLKAIDKYETQVSPGHIHQQHIQLAEVVNNEAFIYVKSDKKMVRIILKEIMYFEGQKDYVKIFTINNQTITYQTLTYFEEKLPANQFLRVHRSYIVSLAHIKSYSASALTIQSTTIPIGNTYAREVVKKLDWKV